MASGSVRGASLLAVALAILAAVPAALVRSGNLAAPVEIATLFFGLAVVGASFAMAWGAEAAEHDIPRALALTVVALLAVFPEYAVDIVFAFKAGGDPAFAPYAAANMTGSNRLLLGLGWPTVSVLAWLISGRRVLALTRDAVMPLAFLTIATLYSFTLPLRAHIGLIDTLLLFVLFGAYALMASREATEEPDLVGPAAAIGRLDPVRRRLSILVLFAFAGVVIGGSAAPFADGLVHTGQKLGIDEFLLVQWLAPLASEAPEFLIAALLTARGKGVAALGLLLSAKLNQWTVLIGSLPLAYAVGVVHHTLTAAGADNPANLSIGATLALALPLDSRQVAEVWLTAAQSLFGIAVLASLSFELTEGLLLAGLFIAQLALGGMLRTALHSGVGADQELTLFSLVYLALSVIFGIRARKVVISLLTARRGSR
ncbi:MAG TPA: sodium:proton exchanger [Chloroflexota bacterium]